MEQLCDTKKMTTDEISQAFNKCFVTKEGRIVLSFLKRITLERYLGPDSTIDELRHLEGQRNLVGYIFSQLNKQ